MDNLEKLKQEIIEAAFQEHSKTQMEEGGAVPYIAHGEECPVCKALLAYYEAIA